MSSLRVKARSYSAVAPPPPRTRLSFPNTRSSPPLAHSCTHDGADECAYASANGSADTEPDACAHACTYAAAVSAADTAAFALAEFLTYA